MGNDDVQALKDSVGKVETKIDGLNESISDLRVLIAGNYATKKELDKTKEELQEEIKANKGYPIGMTIICSLLASAITFIVTGGLHAAAK